jgi:tetratricopeptide (TPR) repeat protein
MDQQIGRLLAFLQQHDLDRETLIVALGDHGEGLGDHGEDEHGLLLYDATMHIPMMFAGPGIPAGMKVSCPVSTVDLLPTIVDALHLDPPRTLNGRNLMTAFRGKTLSAQPIYMETEFPLTEYGWSPLQAVCRDGWKFIRAPQNELYNLDIDTGEMTNRLAAEPARAKALRNVLQTVESLMQVQAAEEVEIDAVDRQALESLGYTGGGGQRAREGDILRNPMKFIGLRSEFIRAVGFIEAGRTELAVPILRTLIAASPESYIFHYKLAKIHFEQGRYAKALEEFEEMARMCPDEFRTHYNLGKTLIKLGEYDRAVRELNLALELNDRQVDGYNNLGIALLKTGDWQAAVEAFKRSIAIDADQCDPHNNMGNALMAAGQLQGAIDAYIQAVDADPDSFEARYNLGSALVKRSDWQEAIPHLEKVIQLRPGFEPGRRLLAQAVLQTRQGAIGN